MKKYKKDIQIIDDLIIVKILDMEDNLVCSMDFNRKYIESLGNRYLGVPPYHETDYSVQLDEMFYFLILDIQTKLNLVKYIPNESFTL